MSSTPVERAATGTTDPSNARRVLMIGAGGHARVVLEALHDDPTLRVIGAVSEDGRMIDGLGIPLLGSDLDAVASDTGVLDACVAIGDNAARARLADQWRTTDSRRRLVSAISRHAVVSPSATIGSGTVVFPGAIINPATQIGEGVILNTNASVDHDCHIGAFVHIAPGCALAGGVHIGAGTLVGIGARVLPGIRIGAWATIGAGAVVTEDVADGTTVVGIPARPLDGHGRDDGSVPR